MSTPFAQVDVFASALLSGNPLAVITLDRALPDAQMQALARWTNLSETVFLLPPARADADYSLRIFTPVTELPFAGHPTLGAAFVWADGRAISRTIVQDCAAGLVDIRVDGDVYAFRAPPLRRSDALDAGQAAALAAAVGLRADAVLAGAWVDNGPGWIALQVVDEEALMAARPDYAALAGQRLGLMALTPDAPHAYAVRAFSASGFEDPVTGSLQAGIAQWVQARGVIAADAWQAAQGQAIGRDGLVHVAADAGDLWIGGRVLPVISGQIEL